VSITKQQFADYVKKFHLRELFIDGLGWNIDRTVVPPLEVGGVRYEPKIIADKNGFKIIECAGVSVPLYAARIQVLNALKSRFAELLIIFTDSKQTRQVWLYGYKVAGQNKKAECEYRAGQDPQALYERAAGLFFSLDEEDNITILDVIGRVRDSFTANAERVTKRFYNEFKAQHTALLGFIQGITETVDKEWYASIMLNRLMFCYFMQKRGFLDRNRNYLRHKLTESKEKLGKGKFYSFYRSFLMTLFQKGFGTYEHTPEIKAMIGDIPYLNGGLFDLHEIEKRYPDIDIFDEAFERIFDLFDRYEWHLDTRECASGNEISPDVLGYIFEKYINDRAAMGAYYTQEDITGYISRSTILPYLLEATKKAYGKPFDQSGLVWKFLRESGDRYIFESVKRGLGETLPENIVIGVDTTAPNLIERRKDWNKAVPESVDHLPTEIWREFIERTNRCRATIDKITNGKISDISDLITYNLDIVSFVGDLLDTIEDPKFIQVFYAQLEKVTILDPTCGSGAFLFAALSILEPLYDSCLSRMADYLSHDYKGMLERSTKRYFDEKLEQMESDIHPSKNYFIYKSIILNNLYGVDIMKEAVETAKLRLFLKLVSTAEPNYRADNIGIEPLPDIDFNIKAGNTLIGYATENEVQDALHGNLMGLTKISETMGAMLQLSKAVSRYKQLQLGEGDYRADDFKDAKVDLSARQAKLRVTLDKLLRENDYGDDVTDEIWQNSYQPFHWVSEFYSIIAGNGGFDVVIGNPPYVEKRTVTYEVRGYATESTNNLYAYVLERCECISHEGTMNGYIIPVTSFSTEKFQPFQKTMLRNGFLWINSYDDRPSRLFENLEHIRLSIVVKRHIKDSECVFAAQYRKWSSIERPTLFDQIAHEYIDFKSEMMQSIPKCGSELGSSVLRKLLHQKPICMCFCRHSDFAVFYTRKVSAFLNMLDFTPKIVDSHGQIRNPSEQKELCFHDRESAAIALCAYNSSTFRFFFTTFSECRNVNKREMEAFPLHLDGMDTDLKRQFSTLSPKLMDSIKDTSEIRPLRVGSETLTIQCIIPRHSKAIIDEIDTILAKHYGFTEEELDYIINYDIKYRMGLGGVAEGGDEE
jgi:hypothetical protein